MDQCDFQLLLGEKIVEAVVVEETKADVSDSKPVYSEIAHRNNTITVDGVAVGRRKMFEECNESQETQSEQKMSKEEKEMVSTSTGDASKSQHVQKESMKSGSSREERSSQQYESNSHQYQSSSHQYQSSSSARQHIQGGHTEEKHAMSDANKSSAKGHHRTHSDQEAMVMSLQRSLSRNSQRSDGANFRSMPRNLKGQKPPKTHHRFNPQYHSVEVIPGGRSGAQSSLSNYSDAVSDILPDYGANRHDRKRFSVMSNDSLGGFSQITYTTVSDQSYNPQIDDYATQIEGLDTLRTEVDGLSHHESMNLTKGNRRRSSSDLREYHDDSALLSKAGKIPKGHSKTHCTKCRNLNQERASGAAVRFCWERYYPISTHSQLI